MKLSVRSTAGLVAKLMSKAAKKAKATADKKEVQEALQTTWVLNGILKRAQLTYLYIGKLLNEVRSKEMWRALNHPDIEITRRKDCIFAVLLFIGTSKFSTG